MDQRGFPIFQPGYPNLSGGLVVGGVVHIAGRMVTSDDLVALLQSQLPGVARVENATGLTEKSRLPFPQSRFHQALQKYCVPYGDASGCVSLLRSRASL